MTTLRRTFQLSAHDSQNVRREGGKVARDDGGGSYTTSPPGGLGLIYVRSGPPNIDITLTVAYNPFSTSTADDTDVELDVDQSGRVFVKGLRYIGS